MENHEQHIKRLLPGKLPGHFHSISDDLKQRAAAIRLLVLDVDGVLSNGLLYFGNQQEELKTFHIKDGLGMKLLMRNGIDVAIITGRNSQIVKKRASDLGIKHLMQGREDKAIALRELAAELAIDINAIAYMGDDLPDLGAIQLAGIGITVADSHWLVQEYADWISSLNGGEGAVREACEWLLYSQNKLTNSLLAYCD